MANLWKPSGDHSNALVILFDKKPGNVVIKDAATGQVIEQGRSTGASNGRADTIRFNKPGGAYNNVIVETSSGESFAVGQGAARYEGFNLTAPGQTPKPLGGGTAPTGGGGGGFSTGVPGVAGVAAPGFIDPNFIQPIPISANPINFNEITAANFNFTDPLESAAATGEFNLGQDAANFETALERGKRLQQEELASIQEFAKGISGTQKELVADENTFNQQQRLDAAEVAIPGVQQDLADQRDRAKTLAGGRLLSDAEDRAFELTARSTSADGSAVRGFGDDSVVGRRASDILSAQQRLGITQIGEGLLSSSINQAAGILMDQPLKANISQRLPAQPNAPLASLVQGQQGQLNQLSTISPGQALSTTVQQEQFDTNLNQQTNTFNASNTFAADQFNSNQDFQAQQFNSNQGFQAQQSALAITAGNLQAQQAFDQSVLNQTAQGEITAEQRERLKEAQKQFEKNRDQNQLQQSIASILGVAANSKPVRDVLGGIIETGVDFIDGLINGDDSGGDFVDSNDNGIVDTPEENATFGGNADVDLGDNDLSESSFPEDNDDPVVDLDEDGFPIDYSVETPEVEVTYSSPETDYSSGANLSLNDNDLSEFGGMI